MSKIVLAVLTVAAFLYAAWLVLFRRQMPDPKQSRGLKRRFILATLLFVGLFGTVSVKGGEPMPVAPSPDKIERPASRNQLIYTLKAVWRTLDPSRAQEFRDKLDKAAGDKVIRKKTADMLAVAFSEVAYHKKRTRGDGPRMTCYRPAGMSFYQPRENILKQIELLQKARKSGKIDEEISKKALTAIAREVEMIYRAKGLKRPMDRIEQNQLNTEYSVNKLFASDSATIAAKLIVEMEDGKITDLTPAKRLSSMKDRVETLLTGGKKSYGSGGPAGNDWMDPGINPNVYAILEKAGIMSASRYMVSCYERMAAPVKARSEELKKLQQMLLDENVKAGVLDVEVAGKAAAAADKIEIDYATEKDIRSYQKKVRRIIRILFKQGELPSSFVKKIEIAADVEIISFNSSKALRNDVRWHMRSLLWSYIGDEFVKTLEQRKLIDPARNHRRMMDWSGREQANLIENAKKRLAEFETLLDSKEELKLDGDANVKIRKYLLPKTDFKYRLKIRRVCRALSKTDLVKGGLVNKKQLKSIEEVIGIPIVGTIEK